jgi:hypothetical protein
LKEDRFKPAFPADGGQVRAPSAGGIAFQETSRGIRKKKLKNSRSRLSIRIRDIAYSMLVKLALRQ